MQGTPDAGDTSQEEAAPPLDTLVERADVLVREASALTTRYRDLQERVDGLAAGGDPPVAKPRASTALHHADPAERIRSAATNLALSGSTRDETAAYLESTFGENDYEPILGELFRNAPSGKRPRRHRFRRGR